MRDERCCWVSHAQQHHCCAAAGPHAVAPERPHDPADNDATPGIPPPPGEPCRPSLQARIDLLLQQQARSGKQLISTLLNNREYRNPRFMERLVELNNVQQYGTCFAPSVFDPASLPEEDYLPQIRRRLEQQVRLRLPCWRRHADGRAAKPVAMRAACRS